MTACPTSSILMHAALLRRKSPGTARHPPCRDSAWVLESRAKREGQMANAFGKGDVVVLKSGGPPMTVDEVPGVRKYQKGDDEYLCKWFKGATADQGSYGEHLLQKYVPPAKK
jgi:uncharacterized protein YodC (DUF2158 family)